MKGTNEDSVKYYFTKYVEVAVGRAKKDYLNKQKYHGQWEIPTEPEILVVYAKIFREMSYAETGALIRVSGKKAASIYAYAKKKIKKGRKDYGF